MSNIFSKSALLAAGLFLTTTANAALVDEYWIDQANGYGAYDLTNDTGVDIYGFAVANSDAVDAFDTSGLAWEANIIGQAEWDSGNLIEIGINTLAIGTFDSLFAGYTQAIMYSANSFEPVTLADGQTATGFEFYTMFLSSPFVTFDQNFTQIDKGQAVHVNAVPVPAAVWLFISGIIGMASVARRKT